MPRSSILVLFFLIAQFAFAQSQNLSPHLARSEAPRPPVKSTDTIHSVTHLDQHIAPPNSRDLNVSARDPGTQGLEDPDWWVAIFTGLLVLVGSVQAGLFVWQLILIRGSLADAKEAADGAKESAIAATKQAEIAERMLIKRERPYIFIFGVSNIRRRSDPDFDDAYFVEYSVANHGQMPAIIEAAWIGFETSDCASPNLPILVDDGHALAKNQVMASGEERIIRQFFPSGMIAGEAGIIVSMGTSKRETIIPAFDVVEGHDIFFKAVIAYRGPFGDDHETAAEWIYQDGADQFVSRGAPGNYIK